MGRRLGYFMLAAGLAVLVSCNGIFGGGSAGHPVPPIIQSPPHGLDRANSRGKTVYLQVWPTLPGRGVLVSVINDSEKDFALDVQPLCDLTGLKAYIVDTDGKPHDLTVHNFSAAYYTSFHGVKQKTVPDGLENVVLRTGQSFSWPVIVRHPYDEPRLEFVPLPYKILHFEVAFTLKDGSVLRSNPFDLGGRPEMERRSAGSAPKKEFTQRLDSLRWNSQEDTGVRLASFLDLAYMHNCRLLSDEQFKQVLTAATQDASPLVRAHAAEFPTTWQTLIVDADARVRLEALKAAGGPLAEQQRQAPLMSILIARFQDGDATTKVLALEALRWHHDGQIQRQFTDTIARAKADPDENVSATAKKLFDWAK